MGSISSRPPVPAQPQVVYVPAPQTPSTPTSGSSGASNDTQTDNTETQSTQSENRSASLLQRDRSRYGTVLTGFKGLLSQITGNSGRKTLLGE